MCVYVFVFVLYKYCFLFLRKSELVSDIDILIKSLQVRLDSLNCPQSKKKSVSESGLFDKSVGIQNERLRNYKGTHGIQMPMSFFEDWLRIASEEAYHFSLWFDRLQELGSEYGALSTHDGLWRSALETNDDILARLAIVHIVLEGRGLDVETMSTRKFEKAKDFRSMQLLHDIIFKDEITHVNSGVTWFKFVCEHMTPAISDPISHFHSIVRSRFFGSLKPPFNDKARESAGLTKEWYVPLSFPPQKRSKPKEAKK